MPCCLTLEEHFGEFSFESFQRFSFSDGFGDRVPYVGECPCEVFGSVRWVVVAFSVGIWDIDMSSGRESCIVFVDLRSWCVFVIVFWSVQWLFWVYERVHLGTYSEDVEVVQVQYPQL